MSDRRALAKRITLFGKEHENTADTYMDLVLTQHQIHDYNEAFYSSQRALLIRIKLFGEKHVITADKYSDLGRT